jgi:hypothetical protein
LANGAGDQCRRDWTTWTGISNGERNGHDFSDLVTEIVPPQKGNFHGKTDRSIIEKIRRGKFLDVSLDLDRTGIEPGVEEKEVEKNLGGNFAFIIRYID